MEKIQYDENLWFYHDKCKDKHFLIGNPHTFPGRIWAWCPIKKRTFFVSKSEITEYSEQAGYWIKGFMSGNQPSPPRDLNGNVNNESKEYRDWQDRIKIFEDTGYWE